jgi:cyclophilin family peptidyl-prolyl cis-trans isomerase
MSPRLLFSIVLSSIVLAPALLPADILVNTKLQNSASIEDDAAFVLDLREFFQHYADPGPVATFTISMPVPAGEREMLVNYSINNEGVLVPDFSEGGPTITMMTYELASDSTYTNAFEVYAGSFQWMTHELQFQLFPGETPATVANFMTYAQEGDYTNTIIHRNESTGAVFRPRDGLASFNPLPILQTGGWRLHDSDEWLFKYLPNRGAIIFEQNRSNTAGTLSMARTAVLNSATSQFFINVEDNTDSLGTAYAVFAELINMDADLPVLQDFANTPVHDLTSIFPTLPFASTPLYTPFWDDKDSYARISSITIPQGNPEGVTYSWDWYDTDDEVTDAETAARAVFVIEVIDNQLHISRTDTGTASIEVTGTSSGGEASFIVRLNGYNPDALDTFPSSSILQEGWLENSWYGFLKAEEFPFISHNNHGNQYIEPSSTPSELYIFDFILNAWLYTGPVLYPYIFSFSHDEWFYYSRESGNAIDLPRWFYRYNTQEWLIEDDIAL